MIDKELLQKLKAVDWDVQSFNAYPLFISSVATLSGFRLCWGLSYKHFLCVSRNKNIEWRYDKNDYERNGTVFWEKIRTLKDLLILVGEYRKIYQSAFEKSEYRESDLKDMSVAELVDLLSLQINRLYESVGISHIIESASYVCEHTLLKKYGVDSHMVKPHDDSFLRKAGLYARELCEKYNDENFIIKKFNEKYAWVQNSYLGRNEVTIDGIRKLVHEVDLEITEPVSQPEQAKEFISILSHLFSWQDERKAHILESVHVTQPVLDELATKLSISLESVRFLLPDEIGKVINPEFQKELELRTKFFVDYSTNDLKRTLYAGNEAQSFFEALVDGKKMNASEIKGAIAFRGRIVGIARVCLSLESIEQFKEGEVLVASMTRPEYIGAMRRACAFVTDEGGITCHAAIVAREMKKPCIIGTKIATKVLKDGDLVEVDADKGVVTILKRGS